MNEIFNDVLTRIHNHVLPKTKNLRVTNGHKFEQDISPLKYGTEIEAFFMLHIYLLNFNLAIYRFDTRTKSINNKIAEIKATVNGIPLAERKIIKVDYEIPFPYSYSDILRKKTAENWTIPILYALREMRLHNGRVKMSRDLDEMLIEHFASSDYDKELLWQFLLAKYKFVCKSRCLLKPKFIATVPDIIIDDTIIDLKTNTGFSELKNQWSQLLNQLIDFYAFRRFCNVVYDEERITNFDKKKILLPVKKLCLYYFRYNKFFTVDLKKVINEEEFKQLVEVKRDYDNVQF